jgi:hypothetical protein
MIREFVYFKLFDKNWRELGLTEDDLQALEDIILLHPEAGDLIQGSGGLRKLRFALTNTGKSGGARVLYVDFASYDRTYLMGAYAKGQQENITEKQKQEFRRAISVLLEQLRGEQ